MTPYENTPLLIVSDRLRFRIRTNWTNSISTTHEFGLDDLADAVTRDRLNWAISDPERPRPGETRQSLTEQAAQSFVAVAQALRKRGHDPHAVAHFGPVPRNEGAAKVLKTPTLTNLYNARPQSMLPSQLRTVGQLTSPTRTSFEISSSGTWRATASRRRHATPNKRTC